MYRQFRSKGYYSDRKGGGGQSITISLLPSRGRYTVLALLSKTNIFVIFFSAIADGSHLIFSAQPQSVVPNYTLHLYNTYSTPVQHLLYTCTTLTLHLYNTYSTPVQHLLYTCTTPTLHLYNTYSTPVQQLLYTCTTPTQHTTQFPCCDRCDHILNPTQANNQ